MEEKKQAFARWYMRLTLAATAILLSSYLLPDWALTLGMALPGDHSGLLAMVLALSADGIFPEPTSGLLLYGMLSPLIFWVTIDRALSQERYGGLRMLLGSNVVFAVGSVLLDSRGGNSDPLFLLAILLGALWNGLGSWLLQKKPEAA